MMNMWNKYKPFKTRCFGGDFTKQNNRCPQNRYLNESQTNMAVKIMKKFPIYLKTEEQGLRNCSMLGIKLPYQ